MENIQENKSETIYDFKGQQIKAICLDKLDNGGLLLFRDEKKMYAVDENMKVIYFQKIKKDGTPKKSGGFRAALKKPEGEAKVKNFNFRLSPMVAEILEKQKQKTVFVENAILAYNVVLFNNEDEI